MHCLIIDDKTKTSTALAKKLEAVFGVQAVHQAIQPYLIRTLLNEKKIDVIFIRVRLWNPIAFEQHIRVPAVVFLSGGKDKLTDKPGLTVPFQLREPIVLNELYNLLKQLARDPETEPAGYFFVRTERRYHRIFFSDIELIERMKLSYIRIYTRYTSLLISGSLPAILEKLPKGRFIRVSDTLILPVEHLKQIKDKTYAFRGREIALTFRFANGARKEMESMEIGLY